MKYCHIIVPQGDKSGPKKESLFEEFLNLIYNTLPKSTISFEFFGKGQYTFLFLACDENDYPTIESLIYSIFPGCELREVPDYTVLDKKKLMGGTLKLVRSDVYPFKMYDSFETDSQSTLFSFISKIKADDEVWVQFVITPEKDNAYFHWVRGIKSRISKFFEAFSLKDRIKKIGDKSVSEVRIEAANAKQPMDSFKTTIKIGFATLDQGSIVPKLNALINTFAPFNLSDVNEFKMGSKSEGESFVESYKSRKNSSPMTLSIKELATLFHIPNSDETPHIVHMQAKRGEPPEDLPKESGDDVSMFAYTNYHGTAIPFGIKRKDRRRHLYVVGKSGSGKSKLLELLIKRDLDAGKGIGILDPHGDLVDAALKYVPKHRIKDVILFDPSDIDFPISFNPLENVGEEYKMQVTTGFIDIFKKLFGSNWSFRLEHVLRYVTLALLDSPGTTVYSIKKMLTDKNYRQKIVARIKDSNVKSFWVSEFAGWSEKFDAEAITPLLNKIGQLVSSGMIRNIIAQPKNTFDIRKAMDEGKIIMMKVSKGLLGEENSGLLGAMLITKVYQAAMQRADTPEEKRRDFYLYVDEFQNFATGTFAEIMSEARKYGLCLTIAHQYMGQLKDDIRKTVFGNVGSIISFRVGADDAKVLSAEYNPTFSERDIINLGVQEFYTKMTIDGELRESFSGRTMNVPKPESDFTKEIKDFTRQVYCKPRQKVEDDLNKWDEASGEVDTSLEDLESKFEEPLI